MNKIVYEKGINDMCRGWTTKNEENAKIYKLWCHVLERVYDEKLLTKRPTYYNVELCLEWHWLSKFAEDIKEIEGYELWLKTKGVYHLDKDILGVDNIKIYSKETCIFVNHSVNEHEASKTENNFMTGKHGKECPNFKDFVVAIVDNKVISIFEGTMDAERKTGIPQESILRCCNGKYKSSGRYDGEIFIKERTKSGNPIKWKWLKDYEEEMKNNE